VSGPPEQLIEPSETTTEPSVDSASARVWTTPSNTSAYSNSKESIKSSVFGNKKNKSRAVAYARVSSKRQAEEGVSLDAQVERLLAYAEFRGLELDPEDIYIDDGISAAIHLWSRPAGRKMRETIYRERVGHVLALKMDRLFRDVQDCLGSVDELRGIGVDIHILDQDGGTLDTSTSMGRFFLTTIASLAELERGQISERTKIAMKHLKDNSKVFTGPIFGWDRQGDDIVPNWREQDIIDYMRHRHYVQGWSGNKIAKQLNEMKVKGKKGGSWTSSMVLRTCRYTFHENRKMFEAPEWWSTAEYHGSVSW